MPAEPARLPTTPAEVAAAALDGIESHPGAFSMDAWATMTDIVRLQPDRAPTCGTTMCAAGWVAHVTGWTLVVLPDGEDAEVVFSGGEGGDVLVAMSVFAEKGGERRAIEDVARGALGLRAGETFWYAEADTALKRLREIAGREQDAPEAHMNLDAGTGHGAYEYR